MTDNLDELDLNIVHQLYLDGRASITELADRTRAPRQTVTNRLKGLIDRGLLHVKGGLDTRRLGIKISDIGLEIRGDETRREIEKTLRSCPRVLDIFRTPGKANYHVRIWGEEDSTVNSTIESFGDIPNVEIIYTNYLGTPVHGDIIIDIEPRDELAAPCGMLCENCSRYHSSLCAGCPATKHYQNPWLVQKEAGLRRGE